MLSRTHLEVFRRGRFRSTTGTCHYDPYLVSCVCRLRKAFEKFVIAHRWATEGTTIVGPKPHARTPYWIVAWIMDKYAFSDGLRASDIDKSQVRRQGYRREHESSVHNTFQLCPRSEDARLHDPLLRSRAEHRKYLVASRRKWWYIREPFAFPCCVNLYGQPPPTQGKPSGTSPPHLTDSVQTRAGETPTSARAITPEVLQKLFDFNHRPENWEHQPYAPASQSGAAHTASATQDITTGSAGRHILQAVYSIAFTCLMRIDEVLSMCVRHVSAETINGESVLKLVLDFRKTNQNGGAH